MEEGNTSRQATFFSAFRSMALTLQGLSRLQDVWAGTLEVPGLRFSEEDRTAMASLLALHEVDGWQEILSTQLEKIKNPDRKNRFAFVRPSLDADPSVREAFFQTLLKAENREKEPWVLEALSNLHHPLRRDHALRFILPSLQVLEEIQRTGDIFFPGRWVGATLESHNSPEAEGVVRDFLAQRPDYPYQLRLKILQGADPLFRAVEILGPKTT
jgi:aminopeptidase N